MPSFHTKVPNFAHVLFDLSHTNFGRLQLEGTNAIIGVTNAHVGDASFQTTNAAIVLETLHADRTIAVLTTNAPIEIVDLNLMANDAWTAKGALIQTTNAYVLAEARLFISLTIHLGVCKLLPRSNRHSKTATLHLQLLHPTQLLGL